MKNKLFIYVLFATMISGGVYAQQINLPEYPEEEYVQPLEPDVPQSATDW